MKYEELEVEDKKGESIVFTPNIMYVSKNNHKVLKNTLFYLTVAVLLVFNVLFIVDLSTGDALSNISESVQSILK